MKQTPKRDLLAEVVLEHANEPWSKYLYEHMFGSREEPPPTNVIPFPKKLSLERRRQILLAALERDNV
jgi:hypothetical protein